MGLVGWEMEVGDEGGGKVGRRGERGKGGGKGEREREGEGKYGMEVRGRKYKKGKGTYGEEGREVEED